LTQFTVNQGDSMKHAGNPIRLAVSIALILSGLFSLDRSGEKISTLLQPHPPSNSLAANKINNDLLSGRTVPVADERSRTRVHEAYGKLPLRFEANAGQTAPQVEFLSRGSGYSLYLTQAEAVLALSNRKSKTEAGPQSVVRMKFAGANPEPEIEGVGAFSGKSNYLIGNDPSKWRQNVASYEKVRYRSVYPGIDLIYYGNQRQLEYDFVVGAGADPNAIKLDFDGVKQIRVDDQGDLVLNTGDAEVRQNKPVTYQEVDGRRQEIASQYVLDESGEVGFKIGAYDRSRPLVIDPVLRYSTFLGSSADDLPEDIAVDGAGNAYVTGFTKSLDFPTKDPIQAGLSGVSDAFVIKLNPEGSDLVFSTFLGGSDSESGSGIVVDEGGNVCVIGRTESTDFPTVNPLQPASAGGADVFVAKLKGDGSAFIFSTYLGGSDDEFGRALKVDGSGDIYMTGYTASTNFPTVDAFQPARADGIPNPCIPLGPFTCIAPVYSGFEDIFVAKLKGDGSALVFSTYLGGRKEDDGQSLAIDNNGDIYVTGLTGSIEFPTADALQPAKSGGGDAFIAKFDTNGALVYSTYFGGSSSDIGPTISVDGAGNVYLLMYTYSPNLPTVNPLKSTLTGATDLFVVKLNRTGSAILYSTYLGGSNLEGTGDMKVDSQGNAYITGYTASADFPVVNAIQRRLNPGSVCSFPSGNYSEGPLDAFITKLNTSGSGLIYSTYLGGRCGEMGLAIAIGGSGKVYVAGRTLSNDFPITPGAFQNVLSSPLRVGDREAFILRIDD
jgi:Beta-propeller repeat